MFEQIRRLSGQTLIFGIGDAVTRVVSLLLLPLYTRILTPADYGKLAIVTLVTSVVSIILNSGQGTAFFRFYFQDNSVGARRQLTGTVFIYLMISAATILAFLMIFLDRLAVPLFNDASLIPLIQIGLVGTLFEVGSIIPFTTFRVELRAKEYATLSFVRFLINVILNIIAVAVLRWGVIGVIYANVISSGIFLILCLALTFRAMDWTMDLPLLKQLLRFGLPIVPANLAGWALNLSDRFFLERYADLAQVGIYSLSYSIAGILMMVMGWFNTAYPPYVFSIANQENAKETYARIFTYAMSLFALLGLGVSLFSPQVLTIFTRPAYYGASAVVPFVVLAYLFFQMNYMLTFGIDLTGKTVYYPLLIGSAALLNLVLNILLIPPFGMMGAAAATVLAYAWLPIIDYVVVQRFYPVSYEWARLFKLATLTIGTYLASVAVRTNDFWIDSVAGVALVALWAVALYIWGFLTATELATLRTGAHKALAVVQNRAQFLANKLGRAGAK